MSTRKALQQEIEETREAYHQLIQSVPESAFDLPSDNPAWTVGEVLYHMTIAPRMLGNDVKIITKYSWLYRLIPKIVPEGLFHWLNKKSTQYGARQLSHEFLAQTYDAAHEATMRALANVEESDFAKQVQYPDWDPMLAGNVTLERLFHYVKDHFDSHEGQIRAIVASLGTQADGE